MRLHMGMAIDNSKHHGFAFLIADKFDDRYPRTMGKRCFAQIYLTATMVWFGEFDNKLCEVLRNSKFGGRPFSYTVQVCRSKGIIGCNLRIVNHLIVLDLERQYSCFRPKRRQIDTLRKRRHHDLQQPQSGHACANRQQHIFCAPCYAYCQHTGQQASIAQ